jgi:Fibrinogen beta and gamma chains, C-terminal globular domain
VVQDNLADYVAQLVNITVNVSNQSDQITLSLSGWVVIMWRQTYYSSEWGLYWMDYVNGFGFTASKWLGLERIHQLTNTGDWKLRMEYLLDVSTGTPGWFSVEYWTVKVGGLSTFYTINIDG